MKKLLMGAALLLGTVASAGGLLINGAGATFPFPIYSKWFNEYNRLHPDIKFNYQSIGSGGGIKQFTDGTVDFGASDAPMKDDQIAKAPDVVHIPTVLGADGRRLQRPGRRPQSASRPRRWPTSSSGRSPSGTTRRSPRTTRA